MDFLLLLILWCLGSYLAIRVLFPIIFLLAVRPHQVAGRRARRS